MLEAAASPQAVSSRAGFRPTARKSAQWGPLERAAAFDVAKGLATGQLKSVDATAKFCQLCSKLRSTDAFCQFHKSVEAVDAECNFCMMAGC